jgi:hypothetical protein
MFATGISKANKVKIIRPDSASSGVLGVLVQMNDHPTPRNPAMTSSSRSHPKSFSSFLLTAAILTVALLAFEPAGILDLAARSIRFPKDADLFFGRVSLAFHFLGPL